MDNLIPDTDVRKRYKISAMTLWRWDHNPASGFPRPIYINRRKYRYENELRAWEAARPRAGSTSEAAHA